MPSYDGGIPTRAGDAQYTYSFDGWSPEVRPVSGDVTYTVVFEPTPVSYVIDYDLGGGAGSNPETYNCQSKSFTLSLPTKLGYTFVGWTGSNGSNPEREVVINGNWCENLSYKANWTLNSYSVTYHLYGGANSGKNPATITYFDSIDLASPSKDFYRFDGWFFDEFFEEQVSTLEKVLGDLDIYAHFTPFTYTSTFECEEPLCCYVNYIVTNNVSSNRSLLLKEGAEIDVFGYIPAKNGCIFEGWYLDEDCTKLAEGDIHISASLNLYGRFIQISSLSAKPSVILTEEPAVLSYMFSNTSVYQQKSLTFYVPVYADVSETISIIQADRPSSYRYSSLFVQAPGNYMNTSMVYEKSHVQSVKSAEIQPGELYVLEYDIRIPSLGSNISCSQFRGYVRVGQCSVKVSKASIVRTATQQYDQNVVCPSAYKEGYDFVGWVDAKREFIHSIWDYSSDQVFHAQWVAHEYTIEYFLDGGVNDEHNPTRFTINDAFSLKTPTKAGYSFGGWYLDSGFAGSVSEITGSVGRDISLYAKWIPNQYAATLESDGGRTFSRIQFFSGNEIVQTAELCRGETMSYYFPPSETDELVFGGWYRDSQFLDPFDFTEDVREDINLFAKWVSVGDNLWSYPNADVASYILPGCEYRYLAIVSPIDQTVSLLSESDLDLEGALYDCDFNVLATNDDISETDFDFSITAALKAGQLYYLGYRGRLALTEGDAKIVLLGEDLLSNTLECVCDDVPLGIEVTYGAPFSLPPLKKEGFSFDGWFDENGCLVDQSKWDYTENITIYAKWK